MDVRVFFRILIVVLSLSATMITPSFAQRAAATATQNQNIDDAPDLPANAPKRIVRPVVVIDSTTLQAEGLTIHLWGVMPARTMETPIELKAIDTLDRLIGGEPVNCRIMIWDVTEPVARCTAHSNEDLGLVLLQGGYAIVNRHQTYNSVFASAYAEAQESARLARKGIWKIVAVAEREGQVPKWLEPYMATLVPLSIVLGPLLGLLIVGFLLRQSLTRILNHQIGEFEAGRKKDRALLVRERLVLTSLLEGELQENMSRIDAFLVIYSDTLKGMNNPEEVPGYQKTGELIHRHPALSRSIFEANMNKLSLLDLKLAGEISKLYAGVYADPEYITLEPSTPLTDAIAHVERVIAEAEALKKKIEKVMALFHALMAKHLEGAVGAASSPPVS